MNNPRKESIRLSSRKITNCQSAVPDAIILELRGQAHRGVEPIKFQIKYYMLAARISSVNLNAVGVPAQGFNDRQQQLSFLRLFTTRCPYTYNKQINKELTIEPHTL
jgi:hypothetical protein